MNIKFRDQTFYIEETGDQANIVAAIDKVISENKINLHHIQIDGVPYYESFAEVLTEKAIESSNFEIVEAGSLGWLLDLLHTMQNYLKSALGEISPLASSFHQGEDQIDWEQFKELLGGMEWLSEAMQLVASSSFSGPSEAFKTKTKQLTELTEALFSSLEDRDRTLTGDIILYEIQGFYEELQEISINLLSEEKIV
ncbi:hypothetical protein [Cohnella hashimotonis]|uniref:DUF4375 domain-containing protein n=1 Tax=Cohnella hashimotonis TaxID=2826895 RepID=A0ABT6TUE5_9BACL|nr:hypothetical protein [Cohnella hashimotonis]MDI4650354.1 hypothetical protein [Cohnella hashimotonis]